MRETARTDQSDPEDQPPDSLIGGIGRSAYFGPRQPPSGANGQGVRLPRGLENASPPVMHLVIAARRASLLP